MIPHGSTCGNSYCQQAEYYLCMAKATRSPRRKAELYKLMRDCQEMAARWP
jgi:hypothetical protein